MKARSGIQPRSSLIASWLAGWKARLATSLASHVGSSVASSALAASRASWPSGRRPEEGSDFDPPAQVLKVRLEVLGVSYDTRRIFLRFYEETRISWDCLGLPRTS